MQTAEEFDPISIQLKDGAMEAPWYHFSIDDIFECLIEVTDRNIPLFQHPVFSFLKELHTKYGVHIGLHVFLQREIDGKLRSLKEVRDLQDEIKSEGSFLHFGPHALDFPTMPFSQSKEEQIETFDEIYKEIDRIAGKESYSRWVRLHFYSEMYELADYFKEKGVEALFSTDRPVGSHRMPDEIKQQLIQKGSATYEGMNFIRTQFRVEFFTSDRLDISAIENNFKNSIDQYGYVIFYTHEYEIIRSEVRQSLRLSLEALSKLSIKSVHRI